MKQKFRLLFLVFIFFVSFSTFNPIYGQVAEPSPAINKNAIYGSVGTAGLYFSANVFYERMIRKGTKGSQFIKAGYGGYAGFGDSGKYVLMHYSGLIGKNKHHLELGGGPLFILGGDTGVQPVRPSATLGYRIQKPGGHFMFRTGVSFPEAIYVGIGFAF